MNIKKTISTKLVLLGDSAVGKSSIVCRYIRKQFNDFEEPTIGASFLTSTLEFEENKVKFEIWDTAGQERYRSLAPMYYRGATTAMVVYDITSAESYNSAKTWVEEIKKKGDPCCIICIIGNKVDLEKKRKVSTSLVNAYAKENKLLFSEVSAKSGSGVDDIFKTIALSFSDNYDENYKKSSNVIEMNNSNEIIVSRKRGFFSYC